MELQSGTIPERDHSGDKSPATSKGSEESRRRFAHIQGWGADLDHKNRPAHPMERTPPRLENVHWHQPEDQPVKMTVFHSTERPGITPVFGTSTPPSGISGWIRRMAYKLSENDIRHWMLLLFADRVNVVEGIVQDLGHGRFPNLLSEMGIKAEYRHNRAGLATKVVAASAVVGLAYYLTRRNRSR